jgi:translation initiation factor IF-1
MEDELEVIDGRVIAALPNTHFRVTTDRGEMIVYLGGKMRIHKIRILVGDRVSIQLDEYGGKGRIIRRF